MVHVSNAELALQTQPMSWCYWLVLMSSARHRLRRAAVWHYYLKIQSACVEPLLHAGLESMQLKMEPIDEIGCSRRAAAERPKPKAATEHPVGCIISQLYLA